MNVGLRLPTPSPSQSPANSARSISSRTSSIRSSASSKSNLPIGSARTQRSDIQAQPIKQGNVQKMLILPFWRHLTKMSKLAIPQKSFILSHLLLNFQKSIFQNQVRISLMRESDCSLNTLKLNLDWVLNFHLHLAPWRHDQFNQVLHRKNQQNLIGHVIMLDEFQPIRRLQIPLILSTIFCY